MSCCSISSTAFRKARRWIIAQASPIEGFDARIRGTNNYADIKGADVVIVTAGVPRKPGMSRDDLIGINTKVVREVGQALKHALPERLRHRHHQSARCDGVGDARGDAACRTTGSSAWPACSTARASVIFLAEEFKVSVEDVTAFVLGGHGDTMVPLIRYSTVAGIPVPDLIKKGWSTKERIDAIVQRTRDGGAEIVGLLKTGSAFYAPAAAAVADGRSRICWTRNACFPVPPISTASTG